MFSPLFRKHCCPAVSSGRIKTGKGIFVSHHPRMESCQLFIFRINNLCKQYFEFAFNIFSRFEGVANNRMEALFFSVPLHGEAGRRNFASGPVRNKVYPDISIPSANEPYRFLLLIPILVFCQCKLLKIRKLNKMQAVYFIVNQ
jgi:hypothetical protein